MYLGLRVESSAIQGLEKHLYAIHSLVDDFEEHVEAEGVEGVEEFLNAELGGLPGHLGHEHKLAEVFDVAAPPRTPGVGEELHRHGRA